MKTILFSSLCNSFIFSTKSGHFSLEKVLNFSILKVWEPCWHDPENDLPACAPLIQNDELDDAQDNGQLEDDNPDIPQPEDAEQMPREEWDNLTGKEVGDRAVILVASMLASSSTVHSTVTYVVEQTAELVNDMSSFVSDSSC